MTCVRADLFRHYGRFSWPLLLRSIALKRTFTPVFTLRLCQALDRAGWRRILQLPARLLHRWASARAAIDLPWQTSIGPGFRIVHGFGLVVNGRSRIGRNVTVFQGVTIGQRDRVTASSRESSYPVIGDEVFIGAFAMVLGSAVGNGAVIAPLSVVLGPVEPGTAVSGNPARVIKHDVEKQVAMPWPGIERRTIIRLRPGSCVSAALCGDNAGGTIA
jgi:serine O-acetyltransferase